MNLRFSASNIWAEILGGKKPMAHRVLFIDDDALLRSAMSRSFIFDYDLTSVSSGSEGLRELTEGGEFLVALIDLQMPQMDGVEFIAKAKSLQNCCKFIVLTGNSDQASVDYVSTSRDVFQLLFKPCTKDEIVEAIEAGISASEDQRTRKLHNGGLLN